MRNLIGRSLTLSRIGGMGSAIRSLIPAALRNLLARDGADVVLVLDSATLDAGRAWADANIGYTAGEFLAQFPTWPYYQDTSGAPAIYPDDPVGLIIDQSQGGGAVVADPFAYDHIPGHNTIPQPDSDQDMTLARMPETGVRNRIDNSNALAPASAGSTYTFDGTDVVVVATMTAQPRVELYLDDVTDLSTTAIIAAKMKPADGYTYGGIGHYSPNAGAVFDLLSGTVMSADGCLDAGVEAAEDGFVWCWIKITAGSTESNNIFKILPCDGEDWKEATIGNTIILRAAHYQIGGEWTGPQSRVSARDVTEEGVPTVYYLHNDGDGAVTLDFEPGTYTVLWRDPRSDVPWRGPELGIAWKTNGNWVINGDGTFEWDGSTAAADAFLSLDANLISGATYEISFTVSDLSGGVRVRVGDISTNDFATYEAGSFTLQEVAAGDDFAFRGEASDAYILSDVSIRQVTKLEDQALSGPHTFYAGGATEIIATQKVLSAADIDAAWEA